MDSAREHRTNPGVSSFRPQHFKQQTRSRAPALADGGISSGQSEGAQVSNTFELTALDAEKFAAPDRAVETVSGAVPRDAEVGAFHAVLRGARRHMRLMVLHPNHAQAGLLRPMRGSIVGMQIADHRFRPEAVETAQIVNGSLKGVAGFNGFQIADVLAEKNVATHANGDCVLEMPADGEHGRNFASHADP